MTSPWALGWPCSRPFQPMPLEGMGPKGEAVASFGEAQGFGRCVTGFLLILQDTVGRGTRAAD